MKLKKLLSYLMILCVFVAGSTFAPISAQAASLSKPTSVSASSVGASQIKLKWKKVSGATGYYVYRATSKSGKYSKIATQSKNSYTSYVSTSLTAGKKYYYKIYAYKGKSKKASAVVSAVPKPIKVSNVGVVKRSSTIAQVFWDYQPSVSGYSVYRSTSKNGTYSYITSTSSLKFTDKNLKSGKTYYYKVKAYKTVNKKKVYGSLSNPKYYNSSKVKTGAINGSYNFAAYSDDVSYDYNTDTVIQDGALVGNASISKAIGDTYHTGSKFTITYKVSQNVTRTEKYQVTSVSNDGYSRQLVLKYIEQTDKNNNTGKVTKRKPNYESVAYNGYGYGSKCYYFAENGTDYTYNDYRTYVDAKLYFQDLDAVEVIYVGDSLFDYYIDSLDSHTYTCYGVTVENSICVFCAP